MVSFFAGVRIISGPLPFAMLCFAILLVAILLFRRRSTAGRGWPVVVFAFVTAGAGFGLAACWLVVDVINAFDTSLSPAARVWVAASFAAIALGLANLRRSRARRKLGALASILVFVLVGAGAVNAEFGQYTTIGSLTGVSSFGALPAQSLQAQRAALAIQAPPAHDLWNTWTPPANLPSRGIVGTVTIPATVSHFAARKAFVYLPPAALVPDPPRLPVLVMMSGQPGSPENVIAAGHIDHLFDAIARQNRGLAPIVVVPDQLSAPGVNPMCVDSPLGNSATYLTTDVPTWIRANLNVASAASSWAIGGFSQGGTCAIQLGAAHPQIFGSILDVSGELAPHTGTPAQTIASGFGGDTAAYDAAKPLALLADHAPYADMVGVFAAGSLDSRYEPMITTVAAAAGAAGIRTTVLTSPGTSHDWSTVRYAIENGMPVILKQMGLTTL